ncbi:hypothetical protein ACFX15_019359 [Malus domestica]
MVAIVTSSREARRCGGSPSKAVAEQRKQTNLRTQAQDINPWNTFGDEDLEQEAIEELVAIEGEDDEKQENLLAVASTNRRHRRRCAFAAINALQPVMYVGDSFQDLAMTLASFYHCTNFFEPLQHVQATQVCKENMALKLTTAVAPL